ncbi:hypothetical protein PVAP13_7KG058118 [Panicum virgatum]|uniref:Uncharacterized protein n=1 Tax=Panicum virgatum TaxID=38727 RepID=A0A8T0QIL6_PANVG|nr:hypothetical protein PVAP13_7KG058118 [Panicum virgatum]
MRNYVRHAHLIRKAVVFSPRLHSGWRIKLSIGTSPSVLFMLMITEAPQKAMERPANISRGDIHKHMTVEDTIYLKQYLMGRQRFDPMDSLAGVQEVSARAADKEE